MKFHTIMLAVGVAFLGFNTVDAGWGSHGSSGGYSYGGSSGASYGGSSGASHGSSGGGLFARLHAKIAARHAASSGGSSGGSSGHTVTYHSSTYGSSGHASSGGSSGYASHGSSGGGLLSRLKAKIAAHRARKHASSGGSSGYTSSGGSSGYTHRVVRRHASSGGSSGTSHLRVSAPVYSTPAYAAPAVSAPAISAPAIHSAPAMGTTPMINGGNGFNLNPGESIIRTEAPVPLSSNAPKIDFSKVAGGLSKDSMLLTIAVSDTAKVFVNDRPTTSVGSIRQFTSEGLRRGYSYDYVVRVEDKGFSDSQTVRVRAGDRKQVVFDRLAMRPSTPETIVTVNVPADARLSLGGNKIKGSGSTRTFRTRQLKLG
ncbi:MAG: TIGR03000 domain-containing protein, partial [Planctomycetota bacterium]